VGKAARWPSGEGEPVRRGQPAQLLYLPSPAPDYRPTASDPLATWTFKGKAYAPLQVHYGFERSVDDWGRPSSTVRPLLVRLVLDAADEDAYLVTYMFDSYQRATSTLVQRHPLSGSKLHELHIQAAYCVGYRGRFAPGDVAGWPSQVLTLHLSAAALTLDGVTVECHSVLPWAAPEEVRRRARSDETRHLAAAAALPAPRRVPKVAAPAPAKPPTLASNSEKSVYGEHLSDTYMRAQGHTKLNDGGLVTPPAAPPAATASTACGSTAIRPLTTSSPKPSTARRSSA
jgi:hypothetical protein